MWQLARKYQRATVGRGGWGGSVGGLALSPSCRWWIIIDGWWQQELTGLIGPDFSCVFRRYSPK